MPPARPAGTPPGPAAASTWPAARHPRRVPAVPRWRAPRQQRRLGQHHLRRLAVRLRHQRRSASPTATARTARSATPGPARARGAERRTGTAATSRTAPATVAGTTCIACHTTQRPDLQPGTTAAAHGGRCSASTTRSTAPATASAATRPPSPPARYVNYFKPRTHDAPGRRLARRRGRTPAPRWSASGQRSHRRHRAARSPLRRAWSPASPRTSATLYNAMLHVSAQASRRR